MMKKSLIALAIAAASSTAFAGADFNGQLRVAISDSDTAGTKVNMADQGSRLGMTVSEDLGGGLKAFGHAEWNIDAADGVESTTGSFTTRQTYVGIQGAFGKVLMGKAYAPYKLIGSASVFEDTAADTQGSLVGNGHDSAYTNAIAYITPDVNGFHAAIAFTNNGDADATLSNSTSAIVAYVNGPLKVSVGAESQGDDTMDGANKGSDATKFNISYKIGDIGLAYTYEDVDRGTSYTSSASGAVTSDYEANLASVTYGMGPVTLAAMYGERDAVTAASDLKRTTVGVIYALSKRTSTAVAYNMDDANGTDTNTWTVQLNHSF